MTQCPYCRLATNDLHAHIPACMVLISQLDPRAPESPRQGRPQKSRGPGQVILRRRRAYHTLHGRRQRL
jgi:hypothetical protein